MGIIQSGCLDLCFFFFSPLLLSLYILFLGAPPAFLIPIAFMIPLCLSVLPLQSAPSSSSKLPLQPHLSICLFKYSVPSKTCKHSIEFANLDSMFLFLLCLFSTSLTPPSVKILTMSLRRWHSLQDASAEPLSSLWSFHLSHLCFCNCLLLTPLSKWLSG